jgi:GNAT superfamily N-acetyltransferase
MLFRTLAIDGDLPYVHQLIGSVESEPAPLPQLRQWIERLSAEGNSSFTAAVDDQEKIAGYGEVVHETWHSPGDYQLWCVVDRQYRRKGIGSQLYQAGLSFCLSHGAKEISSRVRDDDPISFDFASRRGFSVAQHMFESILDLTWFDESPYREVIANLETDGIRFKSLADLGNTREARFQLYEVNRLAGLDIPGSDSLFFSFDEFEQVVCSADWYLPEAQLAALDGDRVIGMAAVRLYPEKSGAYNLMTGVLKPYRGRKIALALKLLAIRYARNHGACYLRTDNSSMNEPMLAINRKLGYQPQPGKYLICLNFVQHTT